MSALEDDLYEDAAFGEAEGAADFYEDEMEDMFAEADFGDEFMEADEWDAMDALEDEYEDEFDGFEAYEFEEDPWEDALAYAMGAESEDEFLGRLWKAAKGVAKNVASGVAKVAPIVSKVAGVIPHPLAQAISKGAGVAGKVANLAQRLRAEGATEEEALDAFAELAAADMRALPVVAGVAARSLVKSKGAAMPMGARKRAVKDVKAAATTLVARGGKKAVRALKPITKSVNRTAAVKGTPVTAKPKVVRATATKVSRSPRMVRKLARPSPAGMTMARGGGAGFSRSYTIQGPARITISQA